VTFRMPLCEPPGLSANMRDARTADLIANLIFQMKYRSAVQIPIEASDKSHSIEKIISTAILLVERHNRSRPVRLLEALILRTFIWLVRVRLNLWIPDLSVGIMQVRPSRALSLDGIVFLSHRRFGVPWIRVSDCKAGSHFRRDCIDVRLNRIVRLLGDHDSFEVGTEVVKHSLERYKCNASIHCSEHLSMIDCVEFVGAEYHHGIIEKGSAVSRNTLLYAAVVARLVKMMGRSEHCKSIDQNL